MPNIYDAGIYSYGHTGRGNVFRRAWNWLMGTFVATPSGRIIVTPQGAFVRI